METLASQDLSNPGTIICGDLAVLVVIWWLFGRGGGNGGGNGRSPYNE